MSTQLAAQPLDSLPESADTVQIQVQAVRVLAHAPAPALPRPLEGVISGVGWHRMCTRVAQSYRSARPGSRLGSRLKALLDTVRDAALRNNRLI